MGKIDHKRKPEARPRGIALRLGLTDKLLVLTILFVMLAEVLIYVPSMESGTGERRASLLGIVPQEPIDEAWRRELQPLASASQLSFRIQTAAGKTLATARHLPSEGRWAWPPRRAQNDAMADSSDCPGIGPTTGGEPRQEPIA